MIAEIIGPSGRVHYRRPPDDPLVAEARRTPGYSVRMVEHETVESIWYCDKCQIEVRRLRCQHCGKLEREAR